MDEMKSISETRIGFESSFEESNYYNSQTQDDLVIGLDIVAKTLEKNRVKAEEQGLK